ncbi:MAG: phosphomannomutase/phosphoglucomutase [Propionibacteriaceae bacterium]|nr:phosphomannomutase/phosphoglucomutase [Propionibacteriaceae bacterium]
MLKPEIFKPNDIRGVVVGKDVEWDEAGAKALGAAFVKVFNLAGSYFVLGRDMRLLGTELSQAFIAGATSMGANLVDLGLTSTDALWYASGVLDLPGVQFTASHNPAVYNGIKICQRGAKPITVDMLAQLRNHALWGLPEAETAGFVTKRDILDDFAAFLRSLVKLTGLKRLKVVVDAGNGIAGILTRKVLGDLVDLIELYFEPDGTFPNHAPNPLDPDNLFDIRKTVVGHGADLGLAFDGDGDRCVIIDERGQVVNSASIIALIAVEMLIREPGSTIVINSVTSRSVSETVRRYWGKIVVSPVGHSFMKAAMGANDAIFGGEHSTHYYFRDFWGADSGMLAALHVISKLGRSPSPLSKLVEKYPSYPTSGEISIAVRDIPEVLDAFEFDFDGLGDVERDKGLTISAPDWWVSLRPSTTESLLRLIVEANTDHTMVWVRDRALSVIQRFREQLPY